MFASSGQAGLFICLYPELMDIPQLYVYIVVVRYCSKTRSTSSGRNDNFRAAGVCGSIFGSCV